MQIISLQIHIKMLARWAFGLAHEMPMKPGQRFDPSTAHHSSTKGLPSRLAHMGVGICSARPRTPRCLRCRRRAHEVTLADLDAALPKDVVGCRSVKVKVWQTISE